MDRSIVERAVRAQILVWRRTLRYSSEGGYLTSFPHCSVGAHGPPRESLNWRAVSRSC
jgi:hypothetical protein